MTDPGTITIIAKRLASGDQQAVEPIWAAYQQRLFQLVRSRLSPRLLRRIDPEDVMQSAFFSFCRAANKRAHSFGSRYDLWSFLCTIAICKTVNAANYHGRARRDFRLDSALANACDSGTFPCCEAFVSRAPAAIEEAISTEECQRLMGALSTDELREIAQMKLAGMTNREIAVVLQCATRTVERKIDRIRCEWKAAGCGN